MAVSIAYYNHTPKLLVNQEVDLTDLRVMLLSDSASFDATHTTTEQVAGADHANEVSGNGWDEGGELIPNVAVTTVNTDDAKIDGDDIEITATGGMIGPARYGLLIGADIGTSPTEYFPLAWIDFDESKQAGETTNFVIRWHDDGIIPFTYTAPA